MPVTLKYKYPPPQDEVTVVSQTVSSDLSHLEEPLSGSGGTVSRGLGSQSKGSGCVLWFAFELSREMRRNTAPTFP